MYMDSDGVQDAFLYAIEVSEAMLQKVDGKPIILNVLNAVYEYLRSYMTSHPDYAVGVTFYGVEGYKQTCCNYLTLHRQDSAGVKKIGQMISHLTKHDSLPPDLTPTPYNLADVFFELSQVFSSNSTRVPTELTKRLVIVTANDDPFQNIPRASEVAVTRCCDLVEKHRLSITPIFIEIGPKKFDVQKFWDLLDYTPLDILPPSLDKSIVTPNNIETIAVARSNPRRILFKTVLKIKDTEIANVHGYNLIRPRKRPTTHKVHIDGETKQVPESKTTRLVSNSAKEVSNEECTRAFKFGNRYLPAMSAEKIKELQDFGSSCIQVIATIDEDLFTNIQHTQHAVFLYPYEGNLEGSIRGFTAFWQSLLKKKKYAIAKVIAKDKYPPVMSVIIPSKAEYFHDQPGIQRVPPGLHILKLPYQDDLRAFPDPPDAQVSKLSTDHQRELMTEIIDKLTIKKGYVPTSYPNPALEWLDLVIEATALSWTMPEPPADKTKPKYNSIQTRVGDKIAEFIASIENPTAKRPKREN